VSDRAAVASKWKVLVTWRRLRSFGKAFKPGRKGQLTAMLGPQPISGSFRQIAKIDPDLATGSARKIFSSDLSIFIWQVWIDTVWIESQPVFPIDLGSVRIDPEPLCLADR